MPRKKGREPARSVRIPDELWDAAQAAVNWRHDSSVSHIIREALAQYVRQTERRRRQQEAAENRGANRGTSSRRGP